MKTQRSAIHLFRPRRLLLLAALVLLLPMQSCDSAEDVFTAVDTTLDPNGFWAVDWNPTSDVCDIPGITMCDIFLDCGPEADDTRLRVSDSSIAIFDERFCQEMIGTFSNDEATFAITLELTITDPVLGTCLLLFSVDGQVSFNSNNSFSGTATDSFSASGGFCLAPISCSRDFFVSGTRCASCSPSLACAPSRFEDLGSVLRDVAERRQNLRPR